MNTNTLPRFRVSLLCCAALAAVSFSSCGKSTEEKEEKERKQKEDAEVARLTQNLHDLGIALHEFHNSHGFLPAPNYGPELPMGGMPGNPRHMHWRLAILPFIEQDPIFRQLMLGKYPGGKDGREFWLNAELLQSRPNTYGGHDDITDPKLTRFRVFSGPNAAWEPGKNVRFADFKDGHATTILVVEAEEAVPWTHAAEIPYGPQTPLPKLGAPGRDFFLALMADGSVIQIKKNTPEATLRALITRDGGETIPDF